MKKILGLIVCMTIFLVGQAIAHGSPPTLEKARHETVVATADAGTPEMSRAEMIAKLELASEQAAQKACTETAARRAEVMDTSDIMQAVTELRANAVSWEQVARLSYTKKRHGAVCRCRNFHHRYRADHIGLTGKMREG